MLENPWDSGLDHTKQPRYQPVVYFIYWHMLGSFNNWNIIHFNNKRHVVRTLIGCIRLCLMALVPICNYYYIQVNSDINSVYPTKLGYYVVKYVFEYLTLQDDTTTYGQVSKVGEIVVKSE